jgi:hypothetical protein
MSNESERIRSIGRKLEVREHLIVIKAEVADMEKQFELALNELADLVGRGKGDQVWTVSLPRVSLPPR